MRIIDDRKKKPYYPRCALGQLCLSERSDRKRGLTCSARSPPPCDQCSKLFDSAQCFDYHLHRCTRLATLYPNRFCVKRPAASSLQLLESRHRALCQQSAAPAAAESHLAQAPTNTSATATDVGGAVAAAATAVNVVTGAGAAGMEQRVHSAHINHSDQSCPKCPGECQEMIAIGNQLQSDSQQDSVMMAAGAALLALAASAEGGLQAAPSHQEEEKRGGPYSSPQPALGNADLSTSLPARVFVDEAVEQQLPVAPQRQPTTWRQPISCSGGEQQVTQTKPTKQQQPLLPEGASLSAGFSLPSLHHLQGNGALYCTTPRSSAVTVSALNAAEQALLQLLDQLRAPDSMLLQLDDVMIRVVQLKDVTEELQRFSTNYSRVLIWVNRRNVQQAWRAVLRLLDE